MRSKLRFFTTMLSSSLNGGARYYSSAWETTPFSAQHSKRAGETTHDDNKIIIYPPSVPAEEVKKVSIEEKLAKDMRKVSNMMKTPNSKAASAKPIVEKIVTTLDEHQKSGGSIDHEFYSKALMYYARAANASSAKGDRIAKKCYEKIIELKSSYLPEAQKLLKEITTGLLDNIPPGVEVIFDDTPDGSIGNDDEEGLYEYGTIDEDGEFKPFSP